jgi:predicted NUDIX family NTP pyrophosphohydrolase
METIRECNAHVLASFPIHLVASFVTSIVQAGVLAYRSDAEGSLQILLITSRKRGRWTIPKGLVGLRLDPRSAARIEAQEEAGISGKVSAEPLGTYEYRKKWYAKCEVSVYAMRVTTQEADWPERHMRKRKWFEPQDAVAAIQRKSLRRFVKGALARLTQADEPAGTRRSTALPHFQP